MNLPSDESRLRRNTITKLIVFLTASNDPQAVATRCMILAHMLGHSNAVSQADLAKRLGVSEAWISRSVKNLRRTVNEIISKP